MTVERVTRFYLGEFQTTLTKGGKYINELDPEEEKALIRCSTQHERLLMRRRGRADVLTVGVVFAALLFSPGLPGRGGQQRTRRRRSSC